MKQTFKLMLQGLATVLPLGLTLYLLYWFVTATEQLARRALLWILPQDLYFPGLGILMTLVVLFLTGLLVNAYAIRHLLRFGERVLESIPLIKSIYGALQDIIKVFNLTERKSVDTVVSLEVADNMHLIGFLTGEGAGRRLFSDTPDSEKVGVYLPMSYQVGGFTVYVEKNRLKPLNIGLEEAMRIALTGGAQRNPGGNQT